MTTGIEFRIPIKVLREQIERKWCLACYLIINWRIKDLIERVNVEIPRETYQVLAEHVYAYVYEDKMPPAAISQTVLNLAEDFVSGNPVELRAGDYIALQNFVRKGAK